MEWRIIYSDGTSYTGEPWNAPTRDVQIIEQGESLLFYHDYYLWRTDLEQWIPCNGMDGLLDHLTAYARHIDAIVMGRYMPAADWQALLDSVNREYISAHNARQMAMRK